MKFEQYKYERPNYEIYKNEILNLIKKFKVEKSSANQLSIVRKINKMRNSLESMSTIASIRHDVNTDDKFYNEERDYWDTYGPLYEEINTNFYEAIINSKFIVELEEEFGTQFLNLAELSLKAFSNEIIEDLQLENKLSSKYAKLIASCKINFEGEERNLSSMGPFLISKDRNVRERAGKAKYNFFVEHEEEFDAIYDKLVKVRDKIAKKLGFENFVELAYVRMMRSDYNPEMVKVFRKQVLDYIVPVANKLYERQRKRLNINKLEYFDEKFEFLSGNATPKGDPQWIIHNGIKMYSELSVETKEFFNFMVDDNLLDLVTKKHKKSGGYCTYIPDYKAPFIFSNFNGTSGDVDVLTHEAGHAFQVYQSRWIDMPECTFPTYESCEIHSMSMEFFTWPWMDLFFKEDTKKYKFIHLGGAIKFIPYGITVDEFQHYVYENPNATPKERKEAWRNIEKKYLPHKNYEKCDFLERGGWWMQQGHIFQTPFYYIDYTLAQICALQFWKKMIEDRESAWKDYVKLCSIGGTKSFLNLVKYANLKSPFEEGCVSSIIKEIERWLEKVDDINL